MSVLFIAVSYHHFTVCPKFNAKVKAVHYNLKNRAFKFATGQNLQSLKELEDINFKLNLENKSVNNKNNKLLVNITNITSEVQGLENKILDIIKEKSVLDQENEILNSKINVHKNEVARKENDFKEQMVEFMKSNRYELDAKEEEIENLTDKLTKFVTQKDISVTAIKQASSVIKEQNNKIIFLENSYDNLREAVKSKNVDNYQTFRLRRKNEVILNNVDKK